MRPPSSPAPELAPPRRWAAPPLGPLAVIGVGQIGGSVALGARAAGAVTEVVGWSRSPETLARARALGIVDRAAGSAAEAAAGAALVVLATPVRSLGAVAAALAPALDASAVVFDVGSVKAAAIRAVEPHLPAGAFVACHPLAGTEKFGPDAASPLLFEGRRCVVCPTSATRASAVATVERLWSALGAEPVRMDAALHDRVLAAGSHLPHVAAYALAAALGKLDVEVGAALRRLPTTSLRDTTRVAASSPAMWRDILLDNRDEVLPLIDALMAEIAGLREAVAAGDAARVEALLAAGKDGRERIVPS
jgi:prephenate dehydrogenase